MCGSFNVISVSKWARRVGFMGRIMWQPFDVRFGSLLERMKRHQQIFDQEMLIQDQVMLNKLHKNQQTLLAQSETIQKSVDESNIREILENLVEGHRTLSSEYQILGKTFNGAEIAKLRRDLAAAQTTLKGHYAALQKSVNESAEKAQISEEAILAIAADRAGMSSSSQTTSTD